MSYEDFIGTFEEIESLRVLSLPQDKQENDKIDNLKDKTVELEELILL